MTNTTMRPATPGDVDAIGEIYNHYIVNTIIHFRTEPLALEEWRDWMAQFSDIGRYRLLVADGDGIEGFAHSTRYNVRQAYDRTVLTSVYLHPDSTGKGLGTRLYMALFDELAREDVHRAIAGISLPNEASVTIHERFGFTEIGTMTEVGFKFGQYHDVMWLEKKL